MNKKNIIKNLAEYVEKEQSGEGSGHDWWHTYRVYKTAKYLANKEGADKFIASAAALLHDLNDWKFVTGNEKPSDISRELLEKFGVDKATNEHICQIVDNVSYKGKLEKSHINSIEGKVVQDADRLDAIGAIGVARVFAYTGSKGREIHNPEIKPDLEAYKVQESQTAINHFHEKLLLLKEDLNTKSAKKIAKNRHKFMESFLREFHREWDAKF